MKYWRYRMYLLPRDDPAMKKILDGSAKRCDIYTEDKPIQSDQHLCNEFVRFVEINLNKIKKVASKKPRVSWTFNFCFILLNCRYRLSAADFVEAIFVLSTDCFVILITLNNQYFCSN